MRYGMRIGRNLGVVRSGGVLLVRISAVLLQSVVLAARFAIFALVDLLAILGRVFAGTGRSTRIALLTDALHECIPDDSAANLAGGPQVWGVFAVDEQFHYGVYPKKALDLVRQYPEQLRKILVVGLFPDAASARTAARKMQRAGFSFDELVALARPGRLSPKKSRVPIPGESGHSEGVGLSGG